MRASVPSPRSRATRWALALAVAALLASPAGCGLVQESKAWYYGVQAYVYGFPLIVMDLTRRPGTAVATAGEFTAPVNQFAVMTQYPDATFRAVPRTGLDTLFATAWADLDQEPLVLSVPDTEGRYYVIALFDMWSNVFASIGKRTTGTAAAELPDRRPGLAGHAAARRQAGLSARRRASSGSMARCRPTDPKDYAVVNALQKQYKLTPLSAWGQTLRAARRGAGSRGR